MAAEPDLDQQPPARRVRHMLLSGTTWRVTTADSQTRPVRGRDLSFKVDQGASGPRLGAPVILNAEMRGDRALVIFSRPDEFARFVSYVS